MTIGAAVVGSAIESPVGAPDQSSARTLAFPGTAGEVVQDAKRTAILVHLENGTDIIWIIVTTSAGRAVERSVRSFQQLAHRCSAVVLVEIMQYGLAGAILI